MITAITRGVGPSMGDCELTYLSRQTIDADKAERQQRMYEQSLRDLGVRLVSLPHAAGLPDCTFVQDTAVVVKEVAVIARMGATTRRKEVEAVQAALSTLRELKFINHDGTLEGGDVIRAGRTFFVGVSRRTNRAGVAQLRDILAPFDYQVREVEVRGCLHLTTACSYLGQNTLLVNRAWVDVSPFERLELLDIPDTEPFAANTILIGGTVLMGDHYPLSRALLESRGFRVQAIDISELEKAEAGLSCLSLLFED